MSVLLEELDDTELTITRKIYENDKKLRAVYVTGDKELILLAAQKAAADKQTTSIEHLLAQTLGSSGLEEAYIASAVAQTTAVLALVYYRMIIGHQAVARINASAAPTADELSDKEKILDYFEHLNKVQFATDFGKLLMELAEANMDQEYLNFDFAASPIQ